jgi:bifunctional DNA-binding transcriptional regulator/antitoxin component of YhaV-PrlF toxin-antitoxin module
MKEFKGAIATVSKGGRIRIPKRVIEFMGIEDNDILVFDFDSDTAYMKLVKLEDLLEK